MTRQEFFTGEVKRGTMKQAARVRPTMAATGLLLVISLGCRDPIRQAVTFDPPATEITLTARDDLSRYEWPVTKDWYVVAKPAQMAFMTSFDQPFKLPDPLSQEVVEWSDLELEEDVSKLLSRGLHLGAPTLDVLLEIKHEDFRGAQAFDLTADGSRLVVIDHQGLALYDASNGKLLGRRPLPPEGSGGGQDFDAVRFCGDRKDFLLASPSKIVRINGSNGTVVAESKGCGEPIAQWIITPDGSSMIMRTQSGKLFGGDTELNYFAAYHFQGDPRFDHVALSFDGSRIGVCVDNIPQTYYQIDYQIVDHRTHDEHRLEGDDVHIVFAANVDAWCDGQQALFREFPKEGQPVYETLPMYWRPVQASACYDETNVHWFLMAGYRLIDDREQVVLFGFNNGNRYETIPQPLRAMPDRMVHDQKAGVVALIDRDGLMLCQRDWWPSHDWYQQAVTVHRLILDGDFSQLEKVMEIIDRQKRLVFGRSPAELNSLIINNIKYHWNRVEHEDPDGDLLTKLEQWRESGSVVAATANARRHYEVAWNARGSGLGYTVTQQAWETYGKHLQLARESLKVALDAEKPPMLAFYLAIMIDLEQGGDLDRVDPLARRAMELYPDALTVISGLAFKFLPQWFGSQGDAISFLLSCSKLIEGDRGALLYAQSLGHIVHRVHASDPNGWRSYDVRRLNRGIEEWFRIGLYPDEDLWRLHWHFHSRASDFDSAKRLLKHWVAHRAAPSFAMTNKPTSRYSAILSQVKQWRAEAAARAEPH